jgi:manganese/iron transport system ATP-binding protein
MDAFLNRQIGELSGGQKKRVFLARSLAQQSKIMLLDEPFTGVDIQTEDSIIELLKELKEQGNIILVSTHNLGSVPEFCDQVVLINKTVIAFGLTEEVFNEVNLSKTFGGVLRHVRFDHTDEPNSKKNEVLILTDDEGALVLSGNRLAKRSDNQI